MKSKYLIIGIVLLFNACKNNERIGSGYLENIINGTLVNSEKGEPKFEKTAFKDRAEELIYIREYLKYKLALIIIEKDSEYVKKAQYELISDGENSSLIDAAKRTRRYDWDYERFMYMIVENNYSFSEVKSQLEKKGEISPKSGYSTTSEALENLLGSKSSDNDIPTSDRNSISTSQKNSYPDYLINLNDYSPELSTVCQDQGYSDCIRDVSSIIKDLSAIRKTHLRNKDNLNYLNFYNTENAISEKRNWDRDFQAIDSYIFENITIYNDIINECDYDWVKKLPKDLYKKYNLNKVEILNNAKPTR